ncbi:cytochrome P450 [Apiospora arundinis]
MAISSLFPQLFAGSFLVLICLLLKRRYLTSIRDIPGPFFASFTGAWQVYKLIKGDQHVDMIKLHRRYGSFVRISHKEVSVGDPDAAREVLQAHLRKTEFYSVFSLPDYNYVNQMSELDPKEQIRKSRNVNPGYALSNVIRSEPQVDTLIQLLEQRLDECINAAQPQQHDEDDAPGGVVDLNRWLTYLTFDVLGEVTFSQPFGFLAAGYDIRGTLANARYLVVYLGFVGRYPAIHHATLGNPLLSKLGIQPTSHLFDTVAVAMENRARNPHVRRDMMAQWEEVRATRPDRMAADEIGNAALANVGAGGDTTSATIQACLHFVVNSGGEKRSVLSRLRQEIDGAQDRGELSEMISYAETQKLPFLQACLKEAYRCHAAFASAFPRVVPAEGFTAGGRTFTSGTVLSVNPWVINSSPSVFGADADTFNPDRWLDAEAAKRMAPYLMQWGTGYNQCPGRNLANLQACKVVAQLVRDYDMEPVQRGGKFTFRNRLLCVPDDHMCRLKRRSRAA